MAVNEKNVLLRSKESTGDTNIIYPITLMDNVDGLDEALSQYADNTLTSAKEYSDANLESAKTYADNAAATKSVVTIITWEDDD